MRGLRAVALVVVAAALTALPAVGGAQTPVQDGAPRCGTEAVGAGVAAPERRPAAPDRALRVATYNILHTQPDLADRALDLRVELVVDALAGAEVDVAGLQEVVESDNHGNAARRVAAGLAEATRTDWHWCYFVANPHCPGEPDQEPGGRGGPCSEAVQDQARPGDTGWASGEAIVSRHPITASGAHRLAPRAYEIPLCATRPGEPLCAFTLLFDTRVIVWGRVDTPFGALDVFTTHLAHSVTELSDATRRVQVTDALNYLDGRAGADGTPDLFVGDFNTREGSDTWQAVVDAGFVDTFRAAAPDADGFTSHQELDAPEPTVTRRIDYVFARPGDCGLAPRDPALLGTEPAPFEDGVVWPSDHFGVAVTAGLGAPCAGPGGAHPTAARR